MKPAALRRRRAVRAARIQVAVGADERAELAIVKAAILRGQITPLADALATKYYTRFNLALDALV